ncbi:MAG: type I glutamate--ammonia ligase, partial [Eubacteriales bacterium]
LVTPPPTDKNIYEMTAEERMAEEIGNLPSDLYEAVQELSKDEVIKSALGNHAYNRFLEAKMIEWDRYRIRVHPWELDEYLAVY